MLRIGLTGGIGSGKSTVLATLAAMGAATVDADAISRSVTAVGGAAIKPIAQAFGANFIAADGSLDRTVMREHVFAHPEARKQLEAIVHPLITQRIADQVAQARAEGRRCVVFDVPLLVESGRWRAQVDRVMVVDCDVQVQIERVMSRSGLTAEQVRAIIAVQATRAQRLAAADIVICNEGYSLGELEALVRQVGQGFGL
ncbi:MAG: dephospho-CoA kinase [Pseudomonadota bacterium]